MNASSERLAFLFDRYYHGIATDQETDELMEMVQKAEQDEQLAALLQNAWDSLNTGETAFSTHNSDGILDNILAHEGNEREEKTFAWMRYLSAAMVVLIGLGAFWAFNRKSAVKETVAQEKKVIDIAPGGNRAMLTLADGSTVFLDRAGSGLLATQGGSEINKTADGQLVYSAKTTGESPATLAMNSISTPKGGQYSIVLPDGSKAWLNASSSLRFPATFPAGERRVEIIGEAFFEVVKNKEKPFRVVFGDNEIEVFGTSFNVMSYNDEASSKTTLVEGSVALKNAKGIKKLIPGQQASVDKNGKIETEAVDTDAVTAWKNGLFYFREAGISDIMRQVVRWYDVDVEYQGSIPVRQFTGKVSRNVNISELLNMLRYAGVKCRLENRTIIITA